jgi:hypothetical protein
LRHTVLAALLISHAFAQDHPILLKVSALLDGRGGVQHNTTIAVEGGKILSIGPSKGRVSFHSGARLESGEWRVLLFCGIKPSVVIR